MGWVDVGGSEARKSSMEENVWIWSLAVGGENSMDGISGLSVGESS